MRTENPFILINCATISPQRMEQGIRLRRKRPCSHGRFGRAHTGHIIVGWSGGYAARNTEQNRARGSNIYPSAVEHIKVDVRVSHPHRDLRSHEWTKIPRGAYYRLNVVPVAIPPLRQRLEDIPHLIESFMRQLGKQNALPKREFSPSAMLLTASII